MGTFPASSTAYCCTSCVDIDPPVKQNWLYKTSWQLSYTGGDVGSPDYEVFWMHPELAGQAGKVARDLDWLGRSYSRSGNVWNLDWIGCAGTRACKKGYHRYSAAIDFTRIQWSNNAYQSLVVPKHSAGGLNNISLFRARRYLAILAMTRKHFGNIYHVHYDTDGSHWHHIHADRGRAAVALSTSNKTDVTIVQIAARFLAGRSDVVVDGAWGPKTESGYNTLRSKFKMTTASGGCFNISPFSTAANQRIFMDIIGKTAMRDKAAGYYTLATPPCPS
jgi:hypothetical protein